MMLLFALTIFSIIAVFIIARIVDYDLAGLWFWRKEKSDPSADTKAFIEATAEHMKNNDRAVDAVYNETQRLDALDAYAFGLIAFFWSVIPVAQAIPIPELSAFLTLVSAAICFLTMWAMDRLEKKIDTYRAVIVRYHQKIALPELPKNLVLPRP